MTVCVAALADHRKAIVLAADKMVGLGAIESEADIQKILALRKDWWVMLAADDISPAFDIVDHARKRLKNARALGIDDVMDAVVKSYQEKRLKQAEAIYLAPRGWKLSEFNSRRVGDVIPQNLRAELDFQMHAHRLSLSLLVAGFDRNGQGHIFSVYDYDNRGDARRHDIPGYHAIGSGSQAAIYMMAYRDVSPVMPVRRMIFHVIEGKYFGELASGVGERTDLYIIRPGKPRIKIIEKAIEEKLIKLCQRLEPRLLDQKAIDVLNSFHGKGMNTIPKLKAKKTKKGLAIGT